MECNDGDEDVTTMEDAPFATIQELIKLSDSIPGPSQLGRRRRGGGRVELQFASAQHSSSRVAGTGSDDNHRSFIVSVIQFT